MYIYDYSYVDFIVFLYLHSHLLSKYLDYPQPTPHLIAPTLSQDVPLQPHTYTNITKESVSFTQASQTQTGISVLAYNTEKEKQESDVRDLNICSSTRLLEKVDESIVLKQVSPAASHLT